MFDKFKRRIQPAINFYHLFWAVLATIYYGFPSTKLKVIGVTGTDGKTTTAHCIYHILKSSGKKVSMISTVYAKIGETEYETGLHVTTPDAVMVQQFLNKAAKNKDEYFVMETTSHALDQNRNFGVHYEIGVITNVTHEHLDYHKTFDRYLATKAKLLRQSKLGIINCDDSSYELLKNVLRSTLQVSRLKTYGLKNKSDHSIDLNKTLKLEIPEYNNYNYLAAYAVCAELGIAKQSILKALKSYKLPLGRREMVYDEKFMIVVDFAHTPNSLKQILSDLRVRADSRKGRLIHVFGAAGLRDALKRPMMGSMSGQYSDISIVTEEDHRSESIDAISKEIISGIKNSESRIKEGTVMIIENRQKAINQAVAMAKKGDIVICTGKAHEKSLNRNGKEEPWNEFDAVKTALNLRNP